MSQTGKWSISIDEENYFGQFDTLEEAMAEGLESDRCWVGQNVAPIAPEQLFDGEVIREWIAHNVRDHDDYAGEWADGCIAASREQCTELAAELRPLIAAWLDRHRLRPTFWNIDPQTIRYVEAGMHCTDPKEDRPGVAAVLEAIQAERTAARIDQL